MHRLIALTLLCPAGLLAQLAPLSPANVTIKADLRAKDTVVAESKTRDGRYRSATTVHQRTLRVSVKTVGKVQPDVGVQWFLFAKDEADRVKVYATGREVRRLDSAGTCVIEVTGEVESRRHRYNGSYLQSKSDGGLVPSGWAVVLWQNGRIVASAGQTRESEELGLVEARKPTTKYQRR